jgi:hypothetical protein
MDNNLTVRIAQPPGINVSLSAPGTLYAKSLNYLDFVFSTGVETPNAIVKRDGNGYANFTTARTVAGAAAIYATATGGTGTFAIDASGTNGSNGFAARSVSGTAALLTSGSGSGAQINSNTGSDIASFQNAAATVFAVERVNGVLRWIKDGNTGRLTPATLTAACTWTLPDGGGTVAVNLGNVNNTSDANKPVSAAQQTALNLKANLSGATFTGAISATNLSGTNTGDLTAGTGINITAGVVSSTVETTVETTIIDGSANAVSSNAVFDALALKAPLASPAFTGSITADGVSNTLPNQTAATSASILTRQLADDRYLINDNASSIIGLALFL